MSLSKRVHIMMDPQRYQQLSAKSAQTNQTVGELVRRAIDQTYFSEEATRKKAWHDFNQRVIELQKHTKQPGKVDYKELINYGRKY